MYRKTINRILIGWVFLLILFVLLGKVSVAAPDGGRTAADFLQIGVGARAAGMGGAFTAVSEGADAAYWNPAGLQSVESGEVILGHFSWFQDMTVEQGAVAQRIGERTSLAASIGFLNYGTIDGRALDGTATGDISAYDWYGSLSLGFQATSALAVGLTGKFINQKLDDLSGSTFAADIGARYEADRFVVAAVASNLGPDMDFEGVSSHLPSAARLAVAVRPFGPSFLTALEYEDRFYGNAVIRHGFEYGYQDQYFLRTGYNFYPSQDDRSLGTGWNFGAGVQFDRLAVDYAFTVGEKFASEDLHRFSVVFTFGQ